MKKTVSFLCFLGLLTFWVTQDAAAQNHLYGFGFNRYGQLDLSCTVKTRSGPIHVRAAMGHRIPGACEDCVIVTASPQGWQNLLIPLSAPTSPNLKYYRDLAVRELPRHDSRTRVVLTRVYSYNPSTPYRHDLPFYGIVWLQQKNAYGEHLNRFVLFKKNNKGLPASVGLCQ